MSSNRTLLVEGKNDCYVILNLQGARGFRVLDKAEIISCDSVEELLTSLPVRIRASEGGTVGAVLDADTELAGRWDSIRNNLVTLGYKQVPEIPNEAGTIIRSPTNSILPQVGVWLMPDNATTGKLEDFLRFLVPKEDTLLDIADTTIDELPTKPFAPKDRSKALMHTWLAWQEEPGRPFGTAITARYLDLDAEQADAFMNWLRMLFS